MFQFVIRPRSSDGSPFPITNESHNVYFYISPQRGGEATDTYTASALIENGNIRATIFPSIGNQLDPALTYFYDVSVEKKIDTKELYTLLTGNISVTADITRPGS